MKAHGRSQYDEEMAWEICSSGAEAVDKARTLPTFAYIMYVYICIYIYIYI